MDEINPASSATLGHGDAANHLANGCVASHCKDGRGDEVHDHSSMEEKSSSVPPSPAAQRMPPVDAMNVTVATQYGKIDRVRHLFATEGVDVNQSDGEGCYLMHWAAINNRVDLIKFFLSQGAAVDQIGGDLMASPLHWATRSGHLESVVILIRAGADPLLKDKEGLNCVMVATAFEHTQCLAYILAKLGHHFDINAMDNEGRTAALWACCRNREADPLRLLLSCGANLDIHDSKKRSPLHWTAFIAAEKNMKLVIQTNQCDPTQRDVDGLTAVDHAENTHLLWIHRPMRAYDWRFRRRNGQSRSREGVLGTVWQRIRFDDDLHSKFMAVIPLLLYLFIGLILEQSMSYWLKSALIAVVFYPTVLFVRYFVDQESALMKLPLSISLGTKFWLYASYFAFSYQLRSAPLYVNILFWIIVPLGLFFFYKAVTTDPGTIKSNHDKDVFNKAIIQRVEMMSDSGSAILLDDFCFSCLIRRPLRSKHCATCDRCVARFDHHCPWINNCVAIDNLKYFMGYLLFLGISLCWDMHGNVLLALSKYNSPLKWDGGVWSALELCASLAAASPWAAWNYLNSALYGIGVIILFVCQMYQACINLTTNERMRHFRYKHFRDEQTKKFVNPFHRGYIRNFFDSLDVGIPKIIQPTPVDWRRCYTLKDVELCYNEQLSPSKMA